MRYLAILAVVFAAVTAAIALHDPDTLPASLTDRSIESGIQGLPVPASAVRTRREACAAARCDEEVWAVGGVDDDAVRRWYRGHVEPLEPWRGWASCATVLRLEGLDAHMGGYYRWDDGRTSLDIQVRDASTILVREAVSGDTPCQ